jgi:hypothetical protein
MRGDIRDRIQVGYVCRQNGSLQISLPDAVILIGLWSLPPRGGAA